LKTFEVLVVERIDTTKVNFINNLIYKNMKSRIFGSIAVLAIAAVAVVNVNFSSQQSKLSEVSLANVEALAGCEVLGWTGGNQ
jgi:hypothetical protein